jgi:hypothetical protein
MGTFHPTILPAKSDRMNPATTPIKPAARLRIEDSIKNCAKMDFCASANRASHSNLPCSLRHGNKHDVHDPDSANKERNRCERGQQNGHHGRY